MRTIRVRRSPVIGFALLIGAITVAAAALHGIDVAGMDTAIKPGDDFFQYANGAWIKATPIPADRSSWGNSGILNEEAGERTRTLLEDAAKPDAANVHPDVRKAAQFYTAYMNEAAIESRGLASIQPALQRIDGMTDRKSLATVLGSMLRADVDPLNATNFYTDRLFGLFVAQDLNDPSHNIGYLMQGGLGLPDREYYLGQDAQMNDLRTKYLAHVTAVLTMGQIADAQAKAQRIVDLENKIARAHATREDSADVVKGNNVWTRADFASKAPGLDWAAYFSAAGLDDQPRFIVWHPSAATGESALVASEPVDVWKDYLKYQTFNHWSGLLPKAWTTERFEFYGKTLSGTPQMPVRWKRGINVTGGALGDAVGRAYVAKYFPPEAKAKVEAMVADLKEAFVRRIDRLDWMSEKTKAMAKEKVRTLVVGVGYPDVWRDYSGLEISADDALTNAMKAEDFEYRWQIGKLHRPIDRKEWWMTPQTVNAVNLPIQNALNFPAAMLQPPYFDPEADAAHNYGGVGAVIGHEISHSFDDQGSQFDAAGKLVNWWQPDDFAHFKAAGAKLIAQFNAYEPLPGLHVNGQLTLSENIADVAGLSAAYDAYRLSLKGAEAPTQQGFSGDQRFFLAFAQSWRDVFRPQLLRQIVLTDGHAPSEYRADTARNLDAWYTAFQVQPGQKLYLAPTDRIRVW